MTLNNYILYNMIHGIQLDLIDKLNYLFELSEKRRDDFPNELCTFITTEFNFSSAAIFNYHNSQNIVTLGRSKTAMSIIGANETYSCEECHLSNQDGNYSFQSDPKCQIKISNDSLYEGCTVFNISANKKCLLKLASNSPFAASETNDIQKLVKHIGFLIKLWSKEHDANSETDISKIVESSTTELRTYANSIIGFTSILADDNLTSTQSEYLHTIKSNAQKLLLNINDINELSKLENNKITTKANSININDFVTDIINLFKQKHIGQGIRFDLNTNNLISKTINIDNQKLKFIFFTLTSFLSNITTNKKVEITIEEINSNNFKFMLKSQSTVLTKDKFTSTFVPYSLSSLDELKDTNLTGLSFLLSKKYAEIIGGNLTIEHTDNNVIFNFTIGAKKQNSFESVLGKLPQAGASNDILVIEDDYATSKLMSSYLTKWGYAPTVVNTEKETLSLIQKQKYLAVILDIELPNTNGLELLRKINHNKLSKNTPVIVCSIEADQQKAYLMGAVEYFVKPINYNYLVEILTSYKLRKSSNVLAVDDDLPTLNLVKQAIETAGFNAIAEHISADVMELIKDKNIDLAIIDLDMPHPNGFELIKLIKSDNKFANLPIIIYTGKENFEADLAQIDGLFEHLLSKKSTNIEDLSSAIESMINRVEVPTIEEVIEKEDVIKILLAEDYKHSQIIVTRLLKKNGFPNVVVVENGEEACDIAAKEKFDLILMDMQMPIMNGFEAIEKLRTTPEYKDAPIISLTAFAMKGDREKCIDAGATDYIPKPIDSKEFIEKVKYYTNLIEK